jgi:hypothetical protein
VDAVAAERVQWLREEEVAPLEQAIVARGGAAPSLQPPGRRGAAAPIRGEEGRRHRGEEGQWLERGESGEQRRGESGAELGFGEEKGSGKKVGEKGSRLNRFTPKSHIFVAHPTEVRYG